jgi:hypothetical protein
MVSERTAPSDCPADSGRVVAPAAAGDPSTEGAAGMPDDCPGRVAGDMSGFRGIGPAGGIAGPGVISGDESCPITRVFEFCVIGNRTASTCRISGRRFPENPLVAVYVRVRPFARICSVYEFRR